MNYSKPMNKKLLSTPQSLPTLRTSPKGNSLHSFLHSSHMLIKLSPGLNPAPQNLLILRSPR